MEFTLEHPARRWSNRRVQIYFGVIQAAAVTLLLAQCLPAQQPQANSPTPEQKASGCVWVATSPNGGKLYLCGTIHILREADYPLAPAYEAAYADAQKLVFELPPDSGSGASMNARMQKLAALPEGETLASTVGDEMATTVFKWAAAHGYPASGFEKFQPWYIALMIAAVEYAELGAQPDKGVDNHFEARALRDKKPAQGLETVELQINLFSALTAAQQKELLQQTLAEVKTMAGDFEKLIAAWKSGDLAVLHDLLYREAEQYPDLMDLFLISRNKAWLERLDQHLIKGERIMLLVGAAHLTGPQGLIALLKVKGHTVERYQSAR